MVEARIPLPRFSGVTITLAMLALMALGVATISVSEQAEGVSGYARKQAYFAMAAVAAFSVFAAVPFPRIGRLAYPLFGLTLGLLVVLAWARLTDHDSGLLPSIRGSHRWIDLGFFMAQPSELAKLTYILMLAWYLRQGSHYRTLKGLVPPFVLTFVPLGLILIEPDLGTSLLLLPTLYFMLFMAGAKLRHLGGIVLVATILVLLPLPQGLGGMDAEEARERKALAYWTYGSGDGEVAVLAAPIHIMEPHQLQRISGWLRQGDPKVIQGRGYHLHQSKLVLGSGQLTGRGNWEQADLFFRMLPDDHTDFIFSILGGQWGFLGCLGLFLLYAVIFVSGVEIASTTYDPFGRLVAVGVLGLLATQIFINVGMTMGLMPITGMTLPLISYGGSSLLVNAAALGLLVNVGQRRPISLGRRPFEHKEDTSPHPYRPLEGRSASAEKEADAK